MIGFLCVATTLYGWDAVGQYRQSRGLEAKPEMSDGQRQVMALLNGSIFVWGLASIEYAEVRTSWRCQDGTNRDRSLTVMATTSEHPVPSPLGSGSRSSKLNDVDPGWQVNLQNQVN